MVPGKIVPGGVAALETLYQVTGVGEEPKMPVQGHISPMQVPLVFSGFWGSMKIGI